MKTLLFLLLVAPFQQTPQTFLTWEYNAIPSVVNGWTQTITVNGSPLTIQPTCTPLGTTQTYCNVPVNLSPAPASNNITVMACNTAGCAAANITNLNLATLPVNPQNPKVNITITINVGGS